MRTCGICRVRTICRRAHGCADKYSADFFKVSRRGPLAAVSADGTGAGGFLNLRCKGIKTRLLLRDAPLCLGGRFTLEVAASRYGLLAAQFQCADSRLNPNNYQYGHHCAPSIWTMYQAEPGLAVRTNPIKLLLYCQQIFMYIGWLLVARFARVNLGLIKTVKNGVRSF
jgi:hypothetical protein